MDRATSYLYFTGQFYRRSTTKKATLDALGPYRLWRVRPDGTGLKALTDSKQDALMTRLGADPTGVYTVADSLMARWSGIASRSFRGSSLSYVFVLAQQAPRNGCLSHLGSRIGGWD